jgi:DNA ligase-4
MATMGTPNVNKPTDLKKKDADVNRKLQVYGIISAFQNGKVPSVCSRVMMIIPPKQLPRASKSLTCNVQNDQIDVALNSFLASRALSNPSNKLSSEGQTLIADAREVVKQAKHLLLSKNEGNLLQDFIWQTQNFDPNAVGTPDAPIGKDTAKRHGEQALDGLRTLGTLLITNGQFRKLRT